MYMVCNLTQRAIHRDWLLRPETIDVLRGVSGSVIYIIVLEREPLL